METMMVRHAPSLHTILFSPPALLSGQPVGNDIWVALAWRVGILLRIHTGGEALELVAIYGQGQKDEAILNPVIRRPELQNVYNPLFGKYKLQ
jgi:hypothetical protein